MRRAVTAPKRPVNLPINARTPELARELGINISQMVDALLADEAKRRCWEQSNESNMSAIDAYKARIAKDGLPLAKHRSFCPSCY